MATVECWLFESFKQDYLDCLDPVKKEQFRNAIVGFDECPLIDYCEEEFLRVVEDAKLCCILKNSIDYVKLKHRLFVWYKMDRS
jgi:hypothetical protein